MAVADRIDLPLAIYTENASPHEVRLVRQTLVGRFTDDAPERLIGDKAYDYRPVGQRASRAGRGVDCSAQVEPQEGSNARRASFALLQTALESRAAVCLAAKLSSDSGALRVP